MVKKRETYFKELALTAILFLILDYFLENHLFAFIGLGLVLIGLFIRPVRYANFVIWDWINKVTSAIGEFILLFLIYFLVVTPIGFFFKLRKGKNKSTTSTLVDCEDVFNSENLKKTW